MPKASSGESIALFVVADAHRQPTKLQARVGSFEFDDDVDTVAIRALGQSAVRQPQ